MKKRLFFLIFLIICSIFLFASNHVYAETTTENLEGQLDNLSNTIDNIPKTPEEIRDQYLKQEWNKIISDNKYLGPIHKFFVSNPKIFQIIFGEPYSFSLTFLGIFVLWIYIVLFSKKWFGQPSKSWIGGILVAIGASWLGITKIFVTFVLTLISAQSTAWIRIIFWMIFIVIAIIVFYTESMIAKNIAAGKEKAKKEELERRVSNVEAYQEGEKEGLSLTEKFKKFLRSSR